MADRQLSDAAQALQVPADQNPCSASLRRVPLQGGQGAVQK